jgi:hypothetical protein
MPWAPTLPEPCSMHDLVDGAKGPERVSSHEFAAAIFSLILATGGG